MHHRLSSRKNINLRVRLYRQGVLLGEFTTRNVSQDGFFVEAPNLGLSKHDAIALELYDRDNGWVTIPGVVSHKANNGIGIMFHSHKGVTLSEFELDEMLACQS